MSAAFQDAAFKRGGGCCYKWLAGSAVFNGGRRLSEGGFQRGNTITKDAIM